MPAAKKPDTDLLTLSEVSKQSGISMPTLQRYKKLFQKRIPSVGKGRTQRYKPEAVEVFKQLKTENLAKRGRPKKATTAPTKGAKAKAPAAKSAPKKGASKKKAPATSSKTVAPTKAASDLLTLTEIGNRTGISYPTLLRYAKDHIAKLPHEGSGRKRRFRPEAVGVFNELRAKSGRGRKGAAKKAATKVTPKKAPAKKTGAKKTTPKKAASNGLLTLTEIGKRTRISYPTLLRYVKDHIAKIPHEGTGRKRRFRPEAVDVFNELRAMSGRGRKASTKKAAPKTQTKSVSPAKSPADARLNSRLRKLETSTNKLLRAVERLEKVVSKPVRLEVK